LKNLKNWQRYKAW